MVAVAAEQRRRARLLHRAAVGTAMVALMLRQQRQPAPFRTLPDEVQSGHFTQCVKDADQLSQLIHRFCSCIWPGGGASEGGCRFGRKKEFFFFPNHDTGKSRKCCLLMIDSSTEEELSTDRASTRTGPSESKRERLATRRLLTGLPPPCRSRFPSKYAFSPNTPKIQQNIHSFKPDSALFCKQEPF